MAMEWSGLPPSGQVLEHSETQMEPVFGGFLRVWRNGGKIHAASCVRARARGGGAILCSIPPFLPFEINEVRVSN